VSVGLLALLDDVAALAKAAAASLDDIAAQATKAGAKAAGVVIDDTAVTPRYVTGFSPARELPIIWKIAKGSLRNKLLILLPAALALSLLLPQAVMPLLMLGGLYLCYEGVEKIAGLLFPHAAHGHEAEAETPVADAGAFEDEKVAGAVRTDFILSAEIMTITLGAVPDAGLATQAVVLALVGVIITIGVYGVVALIVKADDFGVVLAGDWSGACPIFSAHSARSAPRRWSGSAAASSCTGLKITASSGRRSLSAPPARPPPAQFPPLAGWPPGWSGRSAQGPSAWLPA
jgi:predicted DNA repair protein MutK